MPRYKGLARTTLQPHQEAQPGALDLSPILIYHSRSTEIVWFCINFIILVNPGRSPGFDGWSSRKVLKSGNHDSGEEDHRWCDRNPLAAEGWGGEQGPGRPYC